MLYFPGAIRFSPDGTMLTFFNGKAEDKGIYLYDMASGELNLIIGITDNEQLYDLAWSPDQNYLMYSVSTSWPPRYWIYDIQAKSKKYAGTGYYGEWGQKSNQLFYNNTSGGWSKIDPKTLSAERVDLPRNSKSKLPKELDLESWGFSYLPSLESVFLAGRVREDHSEIYALASEDLEDEIVFANFDEHEKLRKVIPSPDGKHYLLISQKSLYDENEQHLGFVMYTYLVDVEKLPLSEELKPLPMVAFQWAPDSSVFLAYQLDRSKTGVVPTLDKILVIDIKTLATIAEYRLIDGMGQPALVPIGERNFILYGIDVYWP
jgi:hypothetical protein